MMSLLPPSPLAPAPLRWLGNVVDVALVTLGFALVIAVLGNVVMHAFERDVAWTTEFGEFVMVWTTFLGAAAAVQRNGHMAVGELIDLVPEPGPRLIADGLIQLVVAAVLATLIWKGGIAAQSGWDTELTVTGWPVALQYFSLPVCSSISLIFVFWDLVQILKRVPRNKRYASNQITAS